MPATHAPRIDVTQRRHRLALRHGLAAVSGEVAGAAGPSPAQLTRRLVALHGTDPATVFLSLRARAGAGLTPAAIEEALYERREVVRMLAMRRTVFVVPAESVGIVQTSTSDRIAADQRARLLKLLAETSEVADPAPWLTEVEQSVLAIFAERGVPLSAAELSAAEPRLKTTLQLAAGKAYQVSQNVTSRVLLVLAAQGKIIRGRPAGSWLSQQYRWSLAKDWLPPVSRSDPTESEAKAELARQWLSAFGPAPLTDLKWWTGWTMTQVRQAVATIGCTEVHLGEGAGLVLPDDLEAGARPRSLGRTAPGSRCHRHGLVGSLVVPRPARQGPLRHQRQRRPDDLAGRQDSGRLGSAPLR